MEKEKGWLRTLAQEVNRNAKEQSGWGALGGAALVTALGASALVLGGPLALGVMVGVITSFDVGNAGKDATAKERTMAALSFPIFAVSTYVAIAQHIAHGATELYKDLTFKVEDVAPETKTEWSYDRSPPAKAPKAAASFNGAVPGPGQELAKTTAVAGLTAQRRFHL